MNDLETGFRTAMVGGFQRDDVLRYIEETARAYAQQLTELQERLAQAEDAHALAAADAAALGERNAALADELGRVEGRLAETQAACARGEQAQHHAAEQAEALSARFAALTAQNTQCEAECNRLHAENTRLVARSREYDAARDHLADIELGARRRAAEVEREANEYADALRAEAEAEAADTRREIERIKGEYRDALRRTQIAVNEAGRYTAEILDQFSGEAANTQAEPITLVDEASAPAEEQEEQEQAARGTISDMLSGLRGKPRAEGGAHGTL